MTNSIEKKRNSLVKPILTLALAVVVLIMVCVGNIISAEDATVDIKGSFSVFDFFSAISGGKLSIKTQFSGTLSVIVPKFLSAFIIVLFAFLILLVISHLVKAYLILKENDKARVLELISGGLSILCAAFATIIYFILLFSNVQSTNIWGEQLPLYRTVFPEVTLLITSILLLISGLIDIKMSQEKSRMIKRYLPSYAFMIIPLILIAVFNLYPILLQTVLSFKEYTMSGGVFNSEWIGLTNFKTIVSDPIMLKVIGNTLFLSLLRLVAHTVPPLLLSVFLYDLRRQRTRRVIQNIIYIPHFFSWVIIYAVTYAFLNEEGVLAGILGTNRNLLNDPKWFIPIVIFTDIWKELGWGTILYMAALSSIDTELFEAAKLDGAGPLQRIRHITLPSILPIIVYLLIMNIGNILKAAGGEQLLLFASATTRDKARVIDTWLYWTAYGEVQYSLGAAMSFFQAAIGMVLVFVCNKFSKKATGIGMW